MRNLLAFIVQFSSWLVFFFYAAVSVALLVTHAPYQRHVYLTSAGAIASSVYDVTSNVTGYFHLRGVNDDLNRRTAELEAQVSGLQRKLQSAHELLQQTDLRAQDTLGLFRFVVATVINNSVTHPNNYLTINRGSADGLAPEMGVMDQNGVVGVVSEVAPHHARVISLLNPNFRLSCKLKGADTFGSLVWDCRSPREAILEELPRHTRFHTGDTIVTSGYSAVFPPGIPVGVIKGQVHGRGDDNFFTLRIKLLTDFSALSTVKVISNPEIAEIRAVEASDPAEK